jgi:hypothetical protein
MMGSVPSTFRPPRQQHSAATLDRIVRAAEFQRMIDDLDTHVRDVLDACSGPGRRRSGTPARGGPARVGFLMLDATIREAALFASDRGGPLGVKDADLRRELVRAYIAYLGVRDAP